MPDEKSKWTVYGLDLSLTGTGIACLKESGLPAPADIEISLEEVGTQPKNFTNSLVRVEHIADKILAHINNNKPKMIVIEDYFSGRNPKVIIQLCELGTIVRYKLLKAGYSFTTVTPNQLKKFCLGSGAGGKELVLKGVYKRWGLDLTSNNLADATVLAYMAKAIWNQNNGVSQKLLKYESEIVDKVIKERQVYLPM